MRHKKALTALTTVIFLGVLAGGSLALANEGRDESGGYQIGPLGQVLGAPPAGQNAYGFVPSIHGKQVHKHAKPAHAR